MKSPVPTIDPFAVTIIGLDTGDKPGDHPLFDERIHFPLEDSFVRSILRYGVVQPITLHQEGDKYLVVDGRQRVRAARRVRELQEAEGVEHLLVVTYTIERGDDNRLIGLMNVTNEQRRDDTVLAKARKASRMLAQVKDMDQVMDAFGRTETTIRNWLALLECHPDVLAAIEAGKLAASAGYELAKLGRDEQLEVLKSMLAASAAEAGQDPAAKGVGNTVGERQIREERESRGDRKAQRGIKRSWLTKALKTDAAASLTPDQTGVLTWFVDGMGDRDTWYDDFQVAVTNELA